MDMSGLWVAEMGNEGIRWADLRVNDKLLLPIIR